MEQREREGTMQELVDKMTVVAPSPRKNAVIRKEGSLTEGQNEKKKMRRKRRPCVKFELKREGGVHVPKLSL